MKTIYIFALPEDECKHEYCRIEVSGPIPPKPRKDETLYSSITSPAIDKLMKIFLEEMRQEPHSYCYGIKGRTDQYRMGADQATIFLVMFFRFLPQDTDYVVKERITLSDGSLRERMTTRLTTLCSCS